MRRFVIILMCSSMFCAVSAQSIYDAMPYATVYQDSLITKLLEAKISGAERQEKEVDGYRVQIYSSNRQQIAKGEAISLQQQLSNQLDLPIYVQYMPPFWKVRVGDFQSYDAAREYKERIISLFPELQGDTYVVRDKIHVLQ